MRTYFFTSSVHMVSSNGLSYWSMPQHEWVAPSYMVVQMDVEKQGCGMDGWGGRAGRGGQQEVGAAGGGTECLVEVTCTEVLLSNECDSLLHLMALSLACSVCIDIYTQLCIHI